MNTPGKIKCIVIKFNLSGTIKDINPEYYRYTLQKKGYGFNLIHSLLFNYDNNL